MANNAIDMALEEVVQLAQPVVPVPNEIVNAFVVIAALDDLMEGAIIGQVDNADAWSDAETEEGEFP